jgi:hypothetical protein
MNTTSMPRYEQERRANEAKTKLNKAFDLLRRRGLIARQRFSCCNSCAWYELATYVEEKIDKTPKAKDAIKGCVFYSRQGGFFDGRRVTNLYLQFGHVSTTKHGDVGAPTIEVGKMVCDALKEVGLVPQWDGTESDCVCVRT